MQTPLCVKIAGSMKEVDLMTLVDADYGPVGTPERDALEQEMRDMVVLREVGCIIHKARIASGLTQEQLAGSVGMNKSQISKIESGRLSVSLAKTVRIFSKNRRRFTHPLPRRKA